MTKNLLHTQERCLSKDFLSDSVCSNRQYFTIPIIFIYRSRYMKEYVRIAFESRWITPSVFNIPICEWCNKVKAQDTDHIFWRGGKHNTENRMYDPANLILLCRKCHQDKWGWEWKQKAKEIVKRKLISLGWRMF